MYQTILDKAKSQKQWLSFLEYKQERQHLSKQEEAEILDFIERKAYLPLCSLWEQDSLPNSLPLRRTINKEASQKKRVVYSFFGDEGIFLKFIAFHLFAFDDVLVVSNTTSFLLLKP